MTFVVASARAVTDGLLDITELAAPQPLVVVEIWITLGAATRPCARAKSSNFGSATISASEAPVSFTIIAPRWRLSSSRSLTTALRVCQPKTPCVEFVSSGHAG
jgi:hypothetical protein